MATAVVGVSVPFGGRGLMGLPTSPFGERRPSEVERELAGDELLFYQEYFSVPPGNAERDIERDVRAWMEAILYSLSASPPPPPELAKVDLTSLPDQELLTTLRHTPMCVPPGASMLSRLARPPDRRLPDWLTPADLDFYVEEFERSGFFGPLNYDRCVELDWELLAGHEGRTLQVPALFIGADRDVATIWARTAIDCFADHAPQARPPVVIGDCGHWIQQEKPSETNAALLAFLGGL